MSFIANPSLPDLATVSADLIADWVDALSGITDPVQHKALLHAAGITAEARVTRDQIVALYQAAATSTGDEMMGLWSRPIRSGALKHLCTTLREAETLPGALFRFCSFWNLLLDDYQLSMTEDDHHIGIQLIPRHPQTPQRFGQMLMLKLAHGLMSWLGGTELPLRSVGFAFEQPPFAQDYEVLFPTPVAFDRPFSVLAFEKTLLPPLHRHSRADMRAFLERAPRDWIFTASLEHSLALQVRGALYQSVQYNGSLAQVARTLGLSPRTLARRLDALGLGFQPIKDALRCDIACRALTTGDQSAEAVGLLLGFASPANFHRTFRRWTGMTPGAYRSHSQTRQTPR